MKYKVGDKVRVRKDLCAGDGKVYHMEGGRYGDTFVSAMAHLVGKVVTIRAADKMYAIEEFGYNWTDEMFEPVTVQKIVITTDGTETLARLYDGNEVIKSATAKCSPEDTFDFNTGAKLAFERLIGEEKKEKEKPFKFKVGKQYQHGDRVIEITNARHEADGNHYDFKVIRGKIEGGLSFAENNPWQDSLVLFKWYNGKVVCVKSDRDFTVGKVYEFIDGQVKDNDGTMRPVGAKIKKLEDYNGHLYEFIPFVE